MSIARLHHYVHPDKSDLEICQELMNIDVIGDECRYVFERRWKQHVAKQWKNVGECWRPFRVASKTLETSHIAHIQLESTRGSQSSSEIPVGSYAVLKLPNGLKRTYSVVSGVEHSFVLGVVRDDSSRGGSAFIHEKLQAGDVILVGDIDRSIELNTMASHSIFIVGGIGITAFLAMMKRLASTNQSFEFHYAVRSADDVAFASLLGGFQTSVQIHDKAAGQRVDIDKILQNRVWNSHVYTCGLRRMIDAVITAGANAGMTQDEIHYEVFAADTTGDPFSVKFVSQEKEKVVQVESDQTLLEAMREAGFDLASSCEAGNCGTCRISVLSGKLLHRGTGLTQEEQINEMLACVSRGIGQIVVEI